MKRLISIMCCMVMLPLFVGFVYAEMASVDDKFPVSLDTHNKEEEDKRKFSYCIQTETGTDLYDQYLLSNIDEILEPLVKDPAYFHAEGCSLDTLQIMKPYRVVLESEGERVQSKVLNYAVVADDRIVCVIYIFDTEYGLGYNVSDYIVDLLNEYCVGEGNWRIVYHYDGDKAPVVCLEPVQLRKEANNSVFFDLSGRYSHLENNRGNDALFSFEEVSVNASSQRIQYLLSFITTNTPTRGLSINQNGYKRLQMSNCLVSQATGTNDNCGTACVCTVYRYRTATSTLGISLAEEINTTLLGGTCPMGTTTGQVGMLNYLMPVAAVNQYDYRDQSNGCLTHLEVMHNINNCFPIIYGGYKSQVPNWHAFVLQGYQISGSKMRFYYFNPWGYDSVTLYTTEGAPHHMSDGGVTFEEAGNSVLIEP